MKLNCVMCCSISYQGELAINEHVTIRMQCSGELLSNNRGSRSTIVPKTVAWPYRVRNKVYKQVASGEVFNDVRFQTV